MSNYGSKHTGLFEHQAAEDRAAVQLGRNYWSREWERRRERANDPRLTAERKLEALRCLRIAAYWLARLADGGPGIAPKVGRIRIKCGMLTAEQVATAGKTVPPLRKHFFTL